MPRFVANLTIYAECEVDAETQAEATEYFRRCLAMDQERPEADIIATSSNSGPMRLVNMDPMLGMIGQRTGQKVGALG